MTPYYQDDFATIYLGDCRAILPQMPKADLVLTDPPYGITANKWDIAIANLWAILKPASETFVITSCQPFTTALISANLEHWRHEWVWQKNRGSNFGNTVREPFKEHETVQVFSSGKWTYNPQMEARKGSGLERAAYKVAWNPGGSNYRDFNPRGPVELPSERVPSSIQKFNTETGLHPTQKPLGLFSYLVSTYSNAGDLILDPFIGSGTTLVAAKQLGRRSIGIEIEEKYCEIAARRLQQEYLPLITVVETPQKYSEPSFLFP